MATRRLRLDEYLAVPYLIVMYSFEAPSGEWLRRAEYPELHGCVVDAPTAIEAYLGVERARVRIIEEMYRSGEPIPVPAPPIRAYVGSG